METSREKQYECFNLRTFVFVIGITFLVIQTGFLVLNLLMIVYSTDYIRQITDWFIDRSSEFRNSFLESSNQATNSTLNIPTSSQAPTDEASLKEYVFRVRL